MATMTTTGESVNIGEVMTTMETANLLRRSDETVRQLTERTWHPLPCINTGMGRKRQRLYRRTSILRWLEEEEHRTAP